MDREGVNKTFLFQTGAIKSKSETSTPGIGSGFYSKLVRLKVTISSRSQCCPQPCFYSKLVRLKVQYPLSVLGYYQKFLFQTGAIKSPLAQNDATYLRISFYSKLVRLKARVRILVFMWMSSFYSKLVRLKDVNINGRTYKIGRRFLFQTGAIKRLKAPLPDLIQTSFYSKLVRLKVYVPNRLSPEICFYSKLVRLKGSWDGV